MKTEYNRANFMKHLLAVSLLVTGRFSAFGQSGAAPIPTKPADKSDKVSVAQTLTQMERDWGQAQIKKDFATVEKILAPDWAGIDYDGQVVSRTQIFADMKTGSSTLQSEELSDMKVRVFGNTAVVTGKDTERSTDRGKDSSGKYVWTDVFVLRNGVWQVVASQSTKAP
jgi:ketosteroid isomerase-like protein